MQFEVTDADIASTLGTGDVPVLATSRLVTWMEATTVAAAAHFLADGETSVGVGVRVEHRRPTPLGGRVDVSAETAGPSADRRLTFALQAFDSSGELIGTGEIDRAIVEREPFLQRATASAGNRPE